MSNSLDGVPELWNEFLRTPEFRSPVTSNTPNLPMPDHLALKIIDIYWEVYGELDPKLKMLLDLFRGIDREWNTGLRCSVCGKAAKADDPNYHDGC